MGSSAARRSWKWSRSLARSSLSSSSALAPPASSSSCRRSPGLSAPAASSSPSTASTSLPALGLHGGGPCRPSPPDVLRGRLAGGRAAERLGGSPNAPRAARRRGPWAGAGAGAWAG
ncbi:hypothetical protein AAY473_012582 [Plecturocebus cupreus]